MAPFDPKTCTQTFSIATSDYVDLVILPAVFARLRSDAPNINVRVRSLATTDLEALARRELDVDIDLVVGPIGLGAGSRAFHAERVLHERFTCAVRDDHPMSEERFTLGEFLSLPHANVATRGNGLGVVDAALARLGKKRRVAVEVPHFLAATFLVARTDLVLTIGARVLRAIGSSFALRSVAPPTELALPDFHISLVWHERQHEDPAQAWLRSLIASIAARV